MKPPRQRCGAGRLRYNSVNNRTWEKRLGGLGDAYGYDATQQVTGVQYDATNPDGTPSSPARAVGYTYDAVGNRTNMVDSGTTTYTANALNQYTTVSAAPSAPTYDANGNLTEFENYEFGYDAQSRLTGVEISTPSLDYAFIHDGRGRKVGVSKNGTWTYNFYDSWSLIEEYDASGSQIAATALGAALDEYVFRWSAGYILCYYHQDALGNVTTLTDTTGVVVEKISYDIFGKPSITDAVGTPRTASFYGNRFLFTGREFFEGGIYDYRNRGYLPELGRFLQADPIRFDAGDVNLYRYVFNRPAVLIDPLGLECGITIIRNVGIIGHQSISTPSGSRGFWGTTASLPVDFGEWRDDTDKNADWRNNGNYYEWETERKDSGKIVDESGKEKCCKDASCSDIMACIGSSSNIGPSSTPYTPASQCRTVSEHVIGKCCLSKGKSIHSPKRASSWGWKK
jgi:RHS repeat-associated protein